jgi:preprotein translocase subunit SecD
MIVFAFVLHLYRIFGVNNVAVIKVNGVMVVSCEIQIIELPTT